MKAARSLQCKNKPPRRPLSYHINPKPGVQRETPKWFCGEPDILRLPTVLVRGPPPFLGHTDQRRPLLALLRTKCAAPTHPAHHPSAQQAQGAGVASVTHGVHHQRGNCWLPTICLPSKDRRKVRCPRLTAPRKRAPTARQHMEYHYVTPAHPPQPPRVRTMSRTRRSKLGQPPTRTAGQSPMGIDTKTTGLPPKKIKVR